MAFTISPISRVYRTYSGTFTDEDGQPVIVAAVDVAALPRHAPLTSATAWTSATVTDGELRLLLAGPLADPADALAVSHGGSDVYVRVTDNPEVDAVLLETVLVS